ncbi:MAG: sensor histidine kinase, partial [Chloroflexota bacterium]
FERFYRAGNTRTGTPGQGVGLASVMQIVGQHGGTVTVESVEGAGSTFHVRLPRTSSSDE